MMIQKTSIIHTQLSYKNAIIYRSQQQKLKNSLIQKFNNSWPKIIKKQQFTLNDDNKTQ